MLWSQCSACAEPDTGTSLPSEEALSDSEEAALQSDEDTAFQWLSEPPAGFGSQLSGFGQVHTLLDSLVTDGTMQLLQGKHSMHSTALPKRSSLQVASLAVSNSPDLRVIFSSS